MAALILKWEHGEPAFYAYYYQLCLLEGISSSQDEVSEFIHGLLTLGTLCVHQKCEFCHAHHCCELQL